MLVALIISLIANVVFIVLSYAIIIDYDKALKEINEEWYERCMDIINKTNKEE